MKYLFVVFFVVSIYFIRNVSPCSVNRENLSVSFQSRSVEHNNFCSLGSDAECYKQRKNGNSTAATENYYHQIEKKDTDNNRITPWYLRVPLLPIIFATSPTLPDGECRRHVRKYLEELDKGTLWATRMFDSSTKYPEGIITGHTRHYGNFDQCYEIEATIQSFRPELDPDVVSGKYCSVNIEYRKLNSSTDHVGPYTLQFDENESVWEAIKDKGDYRRIKRHLLELALCVPDTCSEEDIEIALDEPLRKIGIEQGLLMKTGIKGKCQTRKDSPEFSTLGKTFCCMSLGLLVVVGVSTWYDLTSSDLEKLEDASAFENILLCFSARRNFRSITSTTCRHPGFDSIHFIRFISMYVVIFAHQFGEILTNPMMNSQYFEHGYNSSSTAILHTGSLLNEVFFAIGGILHAYYLLEKLDRKKRINFMKDILIRYIRFTPAYLAVIIFITSILPHLGAGPEWDYKIGLESSSCADNWWTNLLYINNYVNTDKICILQSWYINVDFHLYIIVLFVIYVFWKMPRSIGYPFLIVIIFIGCAIPFCITYFSSVEPTLRIKIYTHDMREDPYFSDHYVKTHERLASYSMGVLGGAIIYDEKWFSLKKTKSWVRSLLIVCALISGFAVQFIGFKFFDPNMNWSPFVTALYAGFNKPVVAFSTVFSIFVLSVSDRSDYHHKLLTPRWAQPFAKLTYGAYLVHHIIQSYQIGTARNARTMSVLNTLWESVPVAILSFILSLILALLVEEPVRKMEKLLISKQPQNVKKVN